VFQKHGVELFAITSSTVNRFLKNSLLLETANELYTKRNISRHFLKTSLHYRVKDKSL